MSGKRWGYHAGGRVPPGRPGPGLPHAGWVRVRVRQCGKMLEGLGVPCRGQGAGREGTPWGVWLKGWGLGSLPAGTATRQRPGPGLPHAGWVRVSVRQCGKMLEGLGVPCRGQGAGREGTP